MTTTRKALIAALSTVVVLVSLALLLLTTSASPSKLDVLTGYLAEHDVPVGARADVARLADKLCDMRDQGVNVDAWLSRNWTRQESNYIQWGVFNGGYCDE